MQFWLGMCFLFRKSDHQNPSKIRNHTTFLTENISWAQFGDENFLCLFFTVGINFDKTKKYIYNYKGVSGDD